MDTETKNTLLQIAETLEALRAQIERIAEEEGGPIFPDEAAEKVRKRICLQRGTRVPKDATYTRGLSGAAYVETLKRIEKGELIESDLIERGLLAPKSKPGRRKEKSALDSVPKNKTSDSVAEVVEQMKKDTIELSKRKSTKK